MKFQAHMQCKVAKREKQTQKLDGNFNRPPFPAVFHLLMLHHAIVHAYSLFEASVVLFSGLLGSEKLLCYIFGQREASLPVP